MSGEGTDGDRRPREDPHNGLLSPSQINTFLACNRKWWYQYVEGLPTEESFAMVRGTLVHTVLERLFDYKPPRGITYPKMLEALTERALGLLEEQWNELQVSDRFGNDRKVETVRMVERYLQRLQWQMDPLYDKYLDPGKAWRYTRPSFRELNLVDEQLKLRGIVDAVIDKGDDGLVLVDYKTSKIFKHPHSEEYQRQLFLYALLYERLQGRRPDLVSVQYLLTGEVSNYPVREELVQEARDVVDDVRAGIASTSKADYERNTAYKFCKWCDFHDHCMSDSP